MMKKGSPHRDNRIYAAYRGDTYITDGTLDEIAEKMHWKRDTCRWYINPTAKRRQAGKTKYGHERNCITFTLIE